MLVRVPPDGILPTFHSPALRELLNGVLPPSVRVLNVSRVSTWFSACVQRARPRLSLLAAAARDPAPGELRGLPLTRAQCVLDALLGFRAFEHRGRHALGPGNFAPLLQPR